MLSQRKPRSSRYSSHPSFASQQGVVIIIALFIVALAATMAYTMMSRLARDTERTSMILRNIQAEFYAQGGIAWAKDVLIQNWKNQKSNQTVDNTPIQSPIDTMNGYRINSTIYDLPSRYNINQLSSEEARADFQRVLKVLAPKLPQEDAAKLILSIADWISDINQSNDYTRYYLELPSPYRTAHRKMLSVSELRLVKGMTPQLFDQIEGFVTALPPDVSLNIQYAQAPVLMSLSKNMTFESAKNLEEWFAKSKNVTKEAIGKLDIIKNNNVPESKIIIVSQYFLLKTEVMIEKQRLVLYTLLVRLVKESKPVVKIVWQSKNLSS